MGGGNSVNRNSTRNDRDDGKTRTWNNYYKYAQGFEGKHEHNERKWKYRKESNKCLKVKKCRI